MAVIDQCRSMIDQTLARTVEGLDSCCSSVFFGTNRMFRCCTAVQIASASFVSRACMLVGLNRSSLSYQPRGPDDSIMRQRLRELAVCSSNLHRGDQFFVDPQRMLVAAR
jgi:hypothetical protein